MVLTCCAASLFLSQGRHFTVRPVDSRTYVRTLHTWRQHVDEDSDVYKHSMDYVGWEFVTPRRHTCIGLYCGMELHTMAQVYEGSNRSLWVHSIMCNPVHVESGRVMMDMLLQNGVHVDRQYLLPRWVLLLQYLHETSNSSSIL